MCIKQELFSKDVQRWICVNIGKKQHLALVLKQSNLYKILKKLSGLFISDAKLSENV